MSPSLSWHIFSLGDKVGEEQFQQGCRKLFRAGGANRAKGASRAPEASRGRIVQKMQFAMFCYYYSLLLLAQTKP